MCSVVGFRFHMLVSYHTHGQVSQIVQQSIYCAVRPRDLPFLVACVVQSHTLEINFHREVIRQRYVWSIRDQHIVDVRGRTDWLHIKKCRQHHCRHHHHHHHHAKHPSHHAVSDR